MPLTKPSRKNTYSFTSVEDLDTFFDIMEEAEGGGEPLALNFSLDEYGSDVCDKVVRIAESAASKGFIPEVQVNSTDLDFSVDDLYGFIDCEDKLKEKGLTFYFDDKENLYTIDETIKAHQRATELVEEIKKYGGSPFEKFLIIYQYVTSLIYKEDDVSKANSRELISVLNGDSIVCVGYAKLMEYMCNAVGIPCRRTRCDTFDKDGFYKSSHQTNIVYLKDEKYGIDGYFHVDACWDSVKQENNGRDMFMKYNFCLIPLGDIKHLHGKIEFYEDSEAFYNDNRAEMFHNYFSKHRMVNKLLKYNGISYSKTMQDLKMTRNDFKIKKAKALTVLKSLIREYNIPENIYEGFKTIPEILRFESLLALCFDYDKNKDVIELCMKKLVEHANAPEKKTKTSTVRNNNIYIMIENSKKNMENPDELELIKKAYAKIVGLDTYFDFVEEVKRSSQPIDLKTFSKGLKTSFELQGASKEYATSEAKRAMSSSAKRSVRYFDDGAENCFRKYMTGYMKQKA